MSFQTHALKEDAFEKAEKHHQKVIESCTAQAQPKWDTGNIDLMYDGAYEYVDCLHKAVIKISDVFFVDPEGKKIKKSSLTH
ncbi:MAG: hypothetical protein OEY94_06540 [Alphaproteobacteria bacterium]|nr:hypothetical protein [Alphaproteobacteria bacterium]